jgi:hypothetical protein
MNIIIKEHQYLKILNESLGISRASLHYVNVIYKILEPTVLNFLNTKRDLNEKINIDLNNLKEVYQDFPEDYIEFPIEQIVINLSCKKINKINNNANFFSGGGAYSIRPKKEKTTHVKIPSKFLPKYVTDEINKTIISEFDFTVTIFKNYEETNKDDLLFLLRDAIAHECNHMFEYYKRNENNAPDVDNRFTWSGVKNYNVPKNIWNIWEQFTTMLYFSQPQEMNAMTQEVYSVSLRKSFEEFKQSGYWRSAIVMENFDADEFMDNLVNEINKYNPDYIKPILINLRNWFIKDYVNYGVSEKIPINQKLLSKKEIFSLTKFFEPRIRLAGKKLKSNFIRTFSIPRESI